MFFAQREDQAAREEGIWKAHLMGLREQMLALPPMNKTAPCSKCGGAIAPKYQEAWTKFGVTVPEHMRMICVECGYETKAKPLDAANAILTNGYLAYLGSFTNSSP